MQQILVVNNNGVEQAGLLLVLKAAGYRAAGASTFDEATRWLTDGSPDLVIADERLGEFNGLHVLLRARAGHPHVSAIVTTTATNRGVEADARHLNVKYLIKPDDPMEWLPLISRALETDESDSAEGVCVIHAAPIEDRVEFPRNRARGPRHLKQTPIATPLARSTERLVAGPGIS